MTQDKKPEENKCKECQQDLTTTMRQVGGVHMYCADKYFHEKSELRFKIKPNDGGPWCIETRIGLIEILINSDKDQLFKVKAEYYSKGELDAMPEFEGW